jgi:hypothetical protein
MLKIYIRKSSFTTHLLDNNHSMGPINEIMDVLYTTRKGRFMDTVERFHIYSETRNNNQINDKTRLNATPSLTLSAPMILRRTPTDKVPLKPEPHPVSYHSLLRTHHAVPLCKYKIHSHILNTYSLNIDLYRLSLSHIIFKGLTELRIPSQEP